jgi:uncharacterized SAM-binding protein YcdF (DUF218 family)
VINFINKTVGFFLNPLMIGILLIVVGLVFVICKKHKAATWTLGVSIGWFWFWAMPVTGEWLGLPLEENFPVRLAEDMPKADAIALLGGGVGGCTNYPYADLRSAADRAWHAARLWKAGKAPIIIPSNVGAELADVKLLLDMGVPKEAVMLENKAVNTEENAKFVADILAAKNAKCTKVLLVTSAYHMRRSLYLFKKYAPELECIPAATDYQALPGKDEPFKCQGILPSIGAFAHNNDFVHEYIGYFGYILFR